ncbi:UNVERIFIED_CONTAM: hypothetical protein FKN15_021586 [Acipenser sinensis]
MPCQVIKVLPVSDLNGRHRAIQGFLFHGFKLLRDQEPVNSYYNHNPSDTSNM